MSLLSAPETTSSTLFTPQSALGVALFALLLLFLFQIRRNWLLRVALGDLPPLCL
jgi:hypothetical protein